MPPKHSNQLFGTLEYEVTDNNQVIVHIKLLQSNELFKRKRALQQIQKHLCLIIDDSGSMSGNPILKVREHCARFGEKFFEENGKQITLIKFGTLAKLKTYRSEEEFQYKLRKLNGGSKGTNFANPLRLLKDMIVQESIKELLVVFLTDGQNSDKEQTKEASRELENVLDSIQSKFNVIGFGDDFNV